MNTARGKRTACLWKGTDFIKKVSVRGREIEVVNHIIKLQLRIDDSGDVLSWLVQELYDDLHKEEVGDAECDDDTALGVSTTGGSEALSDIEAGAETDPDEQKGEEHDVDAKIDALVESSGPVRWAPSKHAFFATYDKVRKFFPVSRSVRLDRPRFHALLVDARNAAEMYAESGELRTQNSS